MVAFYLDYAIFTPTSIPIVTPTPKPTPEPTPTPTPSPTPESGAKLEIEDITSDSIYEDANTSGGKYQRYKSTNTDDFIQITNQFLTDDILAHPEAGHIADHNGDLVFRAHQLIKCR